MGRKNTIDGQMNLWDMLAAMEEPSEEKNKESVQESRSGKKRKESFKAGGFPECTSCWCFTCEHSTVGGSIPRPFGDNSRPCPSCELCVSQGSADICVIGSAEEGCSYRAEKEGL